MHRLLVFPLLLAFAFHAAAQPRPVPTPAVPRPPGAAQPDVIQRMEYPNADVISVLRVYEQLTGKRLIYDNTVQGQVNIVVNTPVTREEAIKIIEINLILNGYSLIPAEDNIVKVIGAAKNPRSAGIPIYTALEELPDNDRVVSYLFKLQHANPTELANTLLAYLSPQIWTSVVPLPSSQAILITENTSVIRNLMRVIREIDVPPAEVVSEFIALQRADVKDVIEKLKAIFESDQAAGGAPGAPRVVSPPGQSPNQGAQTSPSVEISAGALTEDSIIVGKIRLTGDIRTNRIHVVTRPVNLPFIRTLIQEFDSDVKFGEPSKRALRYVSAGEVLPVIVKALTEPGREAPQVEQTGGGTRQSTGGATGRDLSSTTSSGGTFTVSEGLSTEPVDTTPEAVIVGNSKIIADKRANAIIVLGNNEVKEKVFKIIDEIDVRAPQVLLNTVIGELSLSDNQEFGVDYLYRTMTAATDTTSTTVPAIRDAFAGIARNTTAPLLDASRILNAAGFAGVTGGLTAFIAPTDSLQIIVRALEATNRFRVTSRPMVFTSNNKKAIIASGQEIAVPVSTLSSLTTGDTAAVQSSIQFKTVALQLEVVPLINADRDVSLDILQKVDSVSGTSTIDGNQIPIISTRYIKTNVSVPNLGTVILGGLITKNDEKGYSGIPVLSRIPLLGPLFRTTTRNKSRTELIILMRPIVTVEPRETVPVREREEERLLIEPDLDATLDQTGHRPVLPEGAPLRSPNPLLRR